MDTSHITELFQVILNWLSLPTAAIVGLVGYNFKRTLSRIEALEIEVIKLQLKIARTEVNMQNLHEKIQRIDDKIDKILDRLAK